MPHIFVTVQGGVAEVDEDTVPNGYTVEIIDYDSIEDDPQGSLDVLSIEALIYLKKFNRSGRLSKHINKAIKAKEQIND